jgi:RNA polymerase sigma factor (sigma-70 family)
MKSYNIHNYVRYKEDVKESIKNLHDYELWGFTRDQLIIKFLPLVENLARKFPTSQQATGVIDITDLIQEGSMGLVAAVDNINWETIKDSDDPEKVLKVFLSKRIKGAIRRAIDINRGSIKLPEHKLNEIRNNPNDEALVALFFNSVFDSIDNNFDTTVNDEFSIDDRYAWQYEDKSKEYNIDMLNTYLLSLMKTHLTQRQYEVLRLFYGLDCDKMSADEIANKLGMQMSTATTRVSQIKKEAIDTLIANTSREQVLDYL